MVIVAALLDTSSHGLWVCMLYAVCLEWATIDPS